MPIGTNKKAHVFWGLFFSSSKKHSHTSVFSQQKKKLKLGWVKNCGAFFLRRAARARGSLFSGI